MLYGLSLRSAVLQCEEVPGDNQQIYICALLALVILADHCKVHVQEVLLILEECWNNSPELQNVPIYQASGLARRAISVYQTYIEMMNDDIKAAFQVRRLPS